MSHATVSTQERASWEISAAVLVYEADGGGRDTSAYATVHPVRPHGHGLRLGAGAPATKEACAVLARALGAASTLTGFIPPQLLYLGARSLIWWRAPAPATMYFNTAKPFAADQREEKSGARLIGKRSGRAPQPGLVFAVTPSGWHVHAVKGAVRPGPESDLFRAPYFNVWANGGICTGNVRLPDHLSTGALDRYERAFFDSEFTHPNVGAKERLVRHPQGSYAFWKELLDRPAGAFPEAALIDEKLTLADLAKKLEKDDSHA